MKAVPVIVWKLTKKNIGSLALLTLQAIITILILIGLIGKVQMVSSARNVTDAFQNQNGIYFTEFACYHDSLPDLTQILSQKAETAAARTGEITDLLLKNDRGETVAAYGYNDTMIETARIPLKEGIWFSQAQPTDKIPVLAIDGQYQVGDELTFLHPRNHTAIKAIVIGTIEDCTYIPTFNRSGTADIATLSFFVSTPQFPLIVPYHCSSIPSFQEEMATDTSVERGKIINTGSQPASEAVQNALKSYGSSVSVERMAVQYRQEIRDHLLTNGIVLLVFSVLSVAGIGGANGIQYILNEKRFIIYYMLGLTQKKCMLIEALRSFSLVMSSFLITIFLYWVTPIRDLYASDSFQINAFTFLLIFLFLLMIYACTSVAFFRKLGRKDLIQSYQQSALE